MSSPISSQLLSFIDHHIDSIELLEVLLLLRERSPASMGVAEVNEIIRSDEDSIRARLLALAGMRLIQESPNEPDYYQYSPKDEHRSVIDDLAAAYRDRRPKIIELIYSRPARDLHHFSNAFLWRRKEKKTDG